MENKGCISVIVPVYNTEAYLDACISSIVGQTYANLQIILVDDGATDRSGEICDAWSTRDSRIRVIHQKNAGVSAARNAGLEAAAGEWIAFADSDDVLPGDAYEKLLAAMGESDLVMGRMRLVDEAGALLRETPGPFPPSDFPLEAFRRELFEEKIYCYLGYLWDKLLRKSIILENGIRFRPEVRLNEDRLFLLEYLLCCKTIAFCGQEVYGYRQRSSGVIASTRRNATVTDSEMTVIDSFHEMAAVAGRESEELYRLVVRKAFESALDLRNRVDKKDRQKLRRINGFLWESAADCLRCSRMGLVEKAKIIGHCVLGR